MNTDDVPTEIIRTWETAVDALRKVECQLGRGTFTPAAKSDLLTALTVVDDAWEDHISRVRAWATKNEGCSRSAER